MVRRLQLLSIVAPINNYDSSTGINRARVEQMEDRLKEDILLEAARWSNGGSMGASHTDSVKTSLQAYLELQTRKFLVDYERIPVTDEKSPKEHDFDTLVDRISRADLKT
ncbi:unnamed protein product [Lactuca virosa]|uniref:Uncharacterized protein n=1 Tax=Lactuca virosa TaxID=75947 RepID=A0AAU9LBE7_9ASTR|nr:unnamed protein product [Lactuca virosa]